MMSAITYSLKKDGGKRLSDHFVVREFRCQDGSDRVLIDTELVVLLEKLRLKFGVPIFISSGYRTPEHNAKVGGSPRSQHMAGTAADIVLNGYSPKEVARAAEELMPKSGGIGLYNSFVHVDVRSRRTRWDSTSGKEKAVEGFWVDYGAQVQARFGLDENTIAYLKEYRFGAELLEKLATRG